MRGCCDLCCSINNICFCCCTNIKSKSTLSISSNQSDISSKKFTVLGDTKGRRHLKAFKFLSKIEECDLVYANFQNELFLVPFCILIDHLKKTVVITIRGTLSIRDVITDMTAECGYFDVDDLIDQPCHIGILNTAQNIYQRIKEENLLAESFRINPNYQLMVTGHSLGAGTATILALKLKAEYPNIKCIAFR